jgi:F1F0 ATPase subunit 2
MSAAADIAGIVLSLLVGAALGAVYFGGLWLTLKRLPSSSHPGLLVFGSYFGRLAVCLLGFFLISLGGHWERLLVCLAGLVAARMVMVRRRRPRAGEI